MIRSTGVLLWGANNIFTVLDHEHSNSVRCRIKGKVLDHGNSQEYNPLAPGDNVVYEAAGEAGKVKDGVILSRADRMNAFTRLNQKRLTPQTVSANIDLLVTVLSPVTPPFRPRFLDRVLVTAGENIPVLIVLNKIDQIEGFEDIAGEAIAAIEERLEAYHRMGYKLLRTSASGGKGTEELASELRGKRTAFFGQSGVGKSTLLNALFPQLDLKVGTISSKYNRGRHTTILSRAYPVDNSLVIDTPGVRELVPYGVEPGDLDFLYRDFIPHIGACQFQPCTHRGEPQCGVRKAVEAGEIHYDRYESYLRLYEELERIAGDLRCQ